MGETSRDADEKATERRRDDALRRMLNTPHKPHKEKGDSKPGESAKKLPSRLGRSVRE